MNGASANFVSFFDLPNELLLQIVYQPGVSLITLAMVSRRFNLFVVNLFLSSRKISNPNEFLPLTLDIWENTRPHRLTPDDLDFLSVMVDLTSVKTLSCRLKTSWMANKFPTAYFAPMQQHKHGYARLCRFIRRLTHITKIDLRLEPPHNSYPYDDSLETWASSVAGLLNVCLEKGCHTLSVWDGSWLSDISIQVNSPAKSKSFLKSLIGSNNSSGLLSGPDWEVEVVPTGTRQSRIRSAAASATLSNLARVQKPLRLTTLQISAPLLLLSPHSNWSHEVFTASRLKTLVFYGIELHPNIWHSALSWMLDTHLPKSLQELTIQSCPDLQQVPLVKFISNLKNLTHLKLSLPLPLFSSTEATLPALDLPKLTSITAPTDFLALLLPHHQNHTGSTRSRVMKFPGLKALAPSIPRLTSLHILVRGVPITGILPDPELDQYRQLLQHIILAFSRSRSHHLSGFNSSPRGIILTSVTIEIRPRDTTIPHIASTGDFSYHPPSTSSFQFVTDLVLPAWNVNYIVTSGDQEDLDLFCQTISTMFPKLRRLKIYDLSEKVGHVIGLARWKEERFKWLVDGLKKAVYTLEKVTALVEVYGEDENERVHEVVLSGDDRL
ncbi:hypothetical protein BDN72DRAFT_879973 [Pluteus cervinus]|uniref:Uncharacterized protein n=1 Tax=Pluteus cervinus TaxID=181527 RepID=A0ACD3AN65_9AGAR|nr:hypothetical protein BDN72DRAFT_879973 [Pluteus cervinus]